MSFSLSLSVFHRCRLQLNHTLYHLLPLCDFFIRHFQSQCWHDGLAICCALLGEWRRDVARNLQQRSSQIFNLLFNSKSKPVIKTKNLQNSISHKIRFRIYFNKNENKMVLKLFPYAREQEQQNKSRTLRARPYVDCWVPVVKGCESSVFNLRLLVNVAGCGCLIFGWVHGKNLCQIGFLNSRKSPVLAFLVSF